MFFLGGQTVTDTGWAGPTAVFVEFESAYESGWVWQLYANRKLIGVTSGPLDRRVIGQLNDGSIPAPLTLVRVDLANKLTDYGSMIPKQPWNRFALEWTATDYPDDADRFEVTAATEAGGDVDPENVVASVEFIGDGDYRTVLPALDGTGLWKYAITARDDASPDGNAGTPVEVSVDAVVIPPDVQQDDDGNRFRLVAEAGTLTASFVY